MHVWVIKWTFLFLFFIFRLKCWNCEGACLIILQETETENNVRHADFLRERKKKLTLKFFFMAFQNDKL